MDINALVIIFLNRISGFGPKTIENLTVKLDNLESIWHFSNYRLKKLGLKNSQIKEFNKTKNNFNAKKIIAELNDKKIKYLTLYNNKYPQKLRNIYDPPPVIFYKGTLNFQLPAVAIIGSRNSTVYGRKIAARTAAELAKMGVNIISGLANGIDGTAHKGALSVEAGITTAVLGNGFDYLYPSQNNILSKKIADNGLMITEFNPEVPPRAQNFPRRNRIISALADLILVVEAGAKSGTLITVDYALEQGKDIMAVPANIDRPNSVGCNKLIKKGAAIFTKVSDITDYLNQYLQQQESKNDFLESKKLINKVYPDLNHDELKILKLFQHEIEIYYDDLIKLSNLTTEKVDRILVKLELMNIIIRLKGKKYQFKGLQNLLKPI
ncbi:DNA-processing protein DprA [Halanaerobium congolense]|jgi:DNA processing protein|uniref:DNA processing protein n=1 Tax=Halanaerobium congolense TaxID=54121 RepID=A0A1G6I5D3_9FIRM|nr:DNA-processing protein DprA [Halanaerobium congolense]KXS48916.1 MAG: DNA processing protein [Halanaerobium sp. T82-1]OEG62405.1 MAG: DNA protecting protein DprA [Halanaerobium sp. MDAL1]PUU91087.1 MAG: DNA processing protein [Halanaerobium sp.]PTX17088.1 DNA processing protein [Halanaerobium congolense]PXV69302.1 DNA processing protein [Halanaerobium congolense]